MIRKILVLLILFYIDTSFAQKALEVEKVTITVSSLDTSIQFFENILDFKLLSINTLRGIELQRLVGISNAKLYVKVAELKLGNETIELQEFFNEEQVREIPLESKSNDLWFQHIAIVVSNMEKAYKKLRHSNINYVSTSPQTLPSYIPEAEGVMAFYFQDPDRHNLEIIYFPNGKGDPKWQRTSEKLFLGIDHSAIGINKTTISANFYENLLGLKTVGHSENYGSEQEHLNQIFGAHLLISGLRAKQGIGIEFLEYLSPPGGKSYPSDSKPTDIWHWHTTIKVNDIDELYNQLLQANTTFISKGIVSLNNRKQFIVRDNDGHAILLIE